MKARFNICGILCILPALPIAGRLFYLQTVRHAELAVKASRTVTGEVPEIKVRGKLLDRNGVILAESLPTYTCAVSKRDVPNKELLLAKLSSILQIPRKELDAKWNKARNFFYVKKEIDPVAYKQLKDEGRKLTGIILNMEYTRYNPSLNLGISLLGGVNNEHNGASGAEQLYDEILSGKTGGIKALKDRFGNLIYDASTAPDEPLSDVYLTIDSTLQFHVEHVLEETVKKNRAAGGIAIVQDPRTGDLLAAASYPNYTGNTMPFQWAYEPGSTFKMVTLSAALDKKTVTPSERFNCEHGQWQFRPKVVLHDDEPEDNLTVAEILAKSSNIGSAKIALKTGVANFFYYVKAFGFGTKTAINFPGESRGMLRNPDKWDQLDLAVKAFGHGIMVTGVQLITAYSAIANKGYLMEPKLLYKVTDSTGKVEFSAKPRQVRRVIAPETVKEMTALLRGVVEEGTGSKAQIRGYTVAGKTGTSKKLVNGKYANNKHIASFIGFVPATNPRYTILISIDEPRTTGYGGQVSAPAFADIAKRLLSDDAIPPDWPETLKEPIKGPQAQQPAAGKKR